MQKISPGIKPTLLILIAFLLIPLLGVAATPATITVTQDKIQDFDFLAPGVGWVLIDQEVYWTQDYGGSWDNISPSNTNTRAAYFLDSSHGYVAGVSTNPSGEVTYTLFYTSDAGNQWDSLLVDSFHPKTPIASSEAIHLFFLNETTGWVVIKQQTSSNFNIGVLFKTTDGGGSWTKHSIPVGEEVHFINEQVGFVVGGLNDDLLYRTEDGGESWETIDPSPNAIAKIDMPAFSTIGDGVLVLREKPGLIRILETTDQGITWTETAALSEEDDSGLTSLIFKDSVLIASSSKQYAFSTSSRKISSLPFNLGGSITKLKGKSPTFISGISTQTICAEPGNGASCESFQDLIYSSDLGQNWRAMPKPIIQQEVEVDTSFSITPKISVLDYPRTSLLSAQGFDICEIPDLGELNHWKNYSPYAAVNLYIGGVSRACANTNLSIEFVQELSLQGWKFIPTWVGQQASCTNFSFPMSTDLEVAERQGRGNAFDAARVARKLGLGAEDDSGTVIYYDLEAFDSTVPKCLPAAKAFINGWVSELHSYGIMAGLYGSTCGSALAEFATIDNPPDVIWPAVWNGYEYDSDVSVFGLSCLSDSLWSQQERIRQYSGGHDEYWAGVEFNIDSNIIDGVVADISDYIGVPSKTLENPSFESGLLPPWQIEENPTSCAWSVTNTTVARTGNYLLRMSKSPSQTNCTGVSQTVPLLPTIGETYRFAVWARSSTAASPRSLSLKITGEGSVAESSSHLFSGIDENWQCLEVSHTIQNSNLNAITAEILLENTDGIQVFLDDAHLSVDTSSLCPTVPIPSDLEASNAAAFDHVTLNWDPVPDTTYYRVYRSDTKTGSRTIIGASSTTSFTDYDGNFLETYFYWVRACNAGSCSPASVYDAGSFSTPHLNFSDGFETGETALWYRTFNSDKINICSSNPISGTYSICANVHTNANTYLENRLANDTDRLTASFNFDPNDADLANQTYTIFRGVGSDGIAFQLRFKYASPNYLVSVQWYSGGALQSSPLIIIPNAPANYQITWNSSMLHARSINTFRQLSFSINGVEKFYANNMDNSGVKVRFLHIGVIPITSTDIGSGTIIFDDITYSGPQYIR